MSRNEEGLMLLENKCAVVTGGASGIGEASAKRLAREGARVAVLDMDEAKARAILADADPKRHLGLACNVADSASVDAAFAKIEAAFGKIDILVNNAGIGRGPNDGSTELYTAQAQRAEQIARGEAPTIDPIQIIHMSDEGWAAVMGVNINGTFHCTRAAVRNMVKHGTKGSIVSIASTSAASGEGSIHYAASKGAIVSFTRCLARELASRGIRINAIHPGPTATPIMSNIPDSMIKALEGTVPLGRMAQPDEVAAAVLFLASGEGSFATGSVLTVNGGSYFC
jgi:3-oxoacyl-[acyl-carrier protein] reductase